jgi:hypothetical protein
MMGLDASFLPPGVNTARVTRSVCRALPSFGRENGCGFEAALALYRSDEGGNETAHLMRQRVRGTEIEKREHLETTGTRGGSR